MNKLQTFQGRESMHWHNRAERRRLFNQHHNKFFPGESWADVNQELFKNWPFVKASGIAYVPNK